MASYTPSKWSVLPLALYGLIGGIAIGAIVTALRGNLDSTQILISAVLSGVGYRAGRSSSLVAQLRSRGETSGADRRRCDAIEAIRRLVERWLAKGKR